MCFMFLVILLCLRALASSNLSLPAGWTAILGKQKKMILSIKFMCFHVVMSCNFESLSVRESEYKLYSTKYCGFVRMHFEVMSQVFTLSWHQTRYSLLASPDVFSIFSTCSVIQKSSQYRLFQWPSLTSSRESELGKRVQSSLAIHHH